MIHIITSLYKVWSKYKEILASTVAGNVCFSRTEQQNREILYLVQYPCPRGCSTPYSSCCANKTRQRLPLPPVSVHDTSNPLSVSEIWVLNLKWAACFFILLFSFLLPISFCLFISSFLHIYLSFSSFSCFSLALLFVCSFHSSFRSLPSLLLPFFVFFISYFSLFTVSFFSFPFCF